MRAGKKRELALGAMIEAGIDKIEQPDFTALVRVSAPSNCAHRRRKYSCGLLAAADLDRLDRQSILVELKGGVPVPGAELSNPNPVLMVRSKVMAFCDSQVSQLKAKLDARHVKTRVVGGTRLSYVEGWHVIAEANRIFGFDGWDRSTKVANCVFSGSKSGNHHAAYVATVRVRVRAGDVTVIREGSGSGEAIAATPGQAHAARP